MNKILKRILICAILIFALIGSIVVVVDPFYHYHKPLPGLKGVLTEKEYQCVGSLRHFDYDAVIAGSSVAENYNNRWFDDKFGCRTIKAIRSYGATADLCYFLDEAFEKHELKYVFYNLDPSSLKTGAYTTFEETGCPMYLYDRNPFNDVNYLFNKDVLFERIPYTLAQSLIGDYDEGESYNWGQWKEFNLDMCTGLYLRHPRIADMKDKNCYDEELVANLSLICDVVEKHPETTFYIFMPPYSMLWWDNVYREGETEFFLYATEVAMKTLSVYDNVVFEYFMNDREIITNLDSNYMDTLHFSPDINRYICDHLGDERYIVDEKSVDSFVSDMSDLAYEIPLELIEPYVPRIKELIE